jgi:hypothetical protein
MGFWLQCAWALASERRPAWRTWEHNKSLTDTCMWKLGLRPLRNSFSGNKKNVIFVAVCMGSPVNVGLLAIVGTYINRSQTHINVEKIGTEAAA